MALFKKKKEERKVTTYLEGYKKTTKSFADRLNQLFGGFEGIDDDLLEELLVVLIEADVGVTTIVRVSILKELLKCTIRRHRGLS